MEISIHAVSAPDKADSAAASCANAGSAKARAGKTRRQTRKRMVAVVFVKNLTKTGLIAKKIIHMMQYVYTWVNKRSVFGQIIFFFIQSALHVCSAELPVRCAYPLISPDSNQTAQPGSYRASIRKGWGSSLLSRVRSGSGAHYPWTMAPPGHAPGILLCFPPGCVQMRCFRRRTGRAARRRKGERRPRKKPA